MEVIALDQYDYEAYRHCHEDSDGWQTYWLPSQGYVTRKVPLLCKSAFDLLRRYLWEVMGRDASYYDEGGPDALEADSWLQYDLDVILFLASARVVRSAAELEED